MLSGISLRFDNFLDLTISLQFFNIIQDDNQFTKEKRSQSNLSRSNKNGGTLRRVAFKDVPPCDSSSEDICTCSSSNSQQG